MKFIGKGQKFAIIDVGTNNILLVLAHKSGHNVTIIDKKSNISALGKNMKDRLLTGSAIRRTKNILNDLITYSRIYTENILVIGTSCSREAKNIDQLTDWLLEKHGIHYMIISGEDEAYFNGLANIKEFGRFNKFLLFDIGGGSTEFTLIKDKRIEKFISVDLGIRRLQNRYGGDLLNKEVRTRKILGKLSFNISGIPLIGIGGTVTSLAAIKKDLQVYDNDLVHKSRISSKELTVLYKKILQLSVAQIAHLIPFDPKRSDIILTGTMIVKEILAFFKADEFHVSDKGFQYGILNLKTSELKDLLKHSV